MTSLKTLTDYSEPLQPNSVDIRTEYLEPITSSSTKFTFRLDQAGYLDTNSMLVFKLAGVGGANDNNHRVNLWNGVLGGIKRVIFQVGDNIINDIQDVYKYSTMKNMNLPTSMRNNYLGHYLGNSLFFDAVKNATSKTDDTNDPTAVPPSYADLSQDGVGGIVVNGGRSGGLFGKADGTGGSAVNSMPIQVDSSNGFQYGITLGMLIPALKGQKIPLFVFDKQRILITIEFNGASKYINSYKNADVNFPNAGGGNGGLAVDGNVVPVDVRMVVDYIIVPSDTQNQLLEQTQKQGGYKLEFYDVVNVEKNIVQGTNGQQQEVEHRIGQNNREVHNIFMWKETANSSMDCNDGVANNTRGRMLMCGSGQKCQGYGREEYNCNIDGRDEFDSFVFSPVSQYNELSAVLGSDFNVVKTHYCNDDNTIQSKMSKLLGGITGSMKPLALSLRNGEPLVVGGGRAIGNYPIVWKWRRQCHNAVIGNFAPKDDEAIKVNYFCEVSRVANIMNTGKGMNVIVSY